MDNQQGDDEMKISDGFWMDKKGYDVRYVAQAYQVETFFHPAKDPRTTYLREHLKTGIEE